MDLHFNMIPKYKRDCFAGIKAILNRFTNDGFGLTEEDVNSLLYYHVSQNLWQLGLEPEPKIAPSVRKVRPLNEEEK